MTGQTGQQLPQLAHADPDRHRRELLRHHGGRRDDRHHLGRHRPLGRLDLRAGRRDHGARAARAGAGRRRRRRAAGARRLRRRSASLCGLLNGAMVVGLRVHPFIITLGTMWILRGIAFVASKAESILVPAALTALPRRRSAWARRSTRCRCWSMLVGDRAGRDLPHAHGDGPARLRARRQPRGQPLRRAAPGPDPDRRVRRLGR